MGYKIREAQTEKIPYMFVIGEKEMESRTISVRRRKVGDMGTKSLDEAVCQVMKEIEDKSRD